MKLELLRAEWEKSAVRPSPVLCGHYESAQTRGTYSCRRYLALSATSASAARLELKLP